jgi:hypothetical protein
MDFNLTPEQQKHFNTLAWFHIGPRRSGRTYVAACFLIKCAMHEPDKSIQVQVLKEDKGYLMEQIRKLIKDDKRFELNYTNKTLTFKANEQNSTD